MKKIIISACLLGTPCRYDGNSVPCDEIISLSEKYCLIPVCPEILGGLQTPRTPAEIVGNEVIMKDGTNVTENYRRGASEVLRLCRLLGADTAILKEKSPSCGSGIIYDGTFSGRLKKGYGVAAKLLSENGILVLGESEAHKLK